MGTWGPGNLDNDYALDEIADRSGALLSTLMERWRRKTSREADEYDYTTLFVEFEILFALEAQNLFSTSEVPPREEIEALAQEFLADWDAFIDRLSPSEDHKAQRRQVMELTFARFAAICDTHRDA